MPDLATLYKGKSPRADDSGMNDDDDILQQQIQLEHTSQSGTQPTDTPSKKSKKKKKRSREEEDDQDEEERKKEKKRKKKEKKLLQSVDEERTEPAIDDAAGSPVNTAASAIENATFKFDAPSQKPPKLPKSSKAKQHTKVPSYGDEDDDVDEDDEPSFLAVQTPMPPKLKTPKPHAVKSSAEQGAKKKPSAIFVYPDGWKPIVNEKGETRYTCPVIGCGMSYSRRDSLGQHLNGKHIGSGEVLEDTGDGRLKVKGAPTPEPEEEDEPVSKQTPSTAKQQTPKAAPKEKSTPKASLLSQAIASTFAAINVPKVLDSIVPAIETPKAKKPKAKSSSKVDDQDAETPKAKEPKAKESKTKDSKAKSPPKLDIPVEESATPKAKSTSKAKPTKAAQNGKKAVNGASAGSALLLEPPSSAMSSPESPISRRRDSALEEWELGPGKMVGNVDAAGDGTDVEEDVAFSSTYISKHNGVKLPTTSFNVHHLTAGASHTFPPNHYSYRSCPVRAGKVNVKMGEVEFDICQDGIFTVKPGVKCVVTNKQYGEAVVFCFNTGVK